MTSPTRPPVPEREVDTRELRRLEARVRDALQQVVDSVDLSARLLGQGDHLLHQWEARSRETVAGAAAERVRDGRRRAAADIDEAAATLDALMAEWSDHAALRSWEDSGWDQPPDELPAIAARIGRLSVPGTAAGPATIAAAPSVGSGHVEIIAAPDARESALAVVENVLLRTLGSAPPGRVRFRIYDPTGLGATLPAFNEFDRQRVAHGTPISNKQGLADALRDISNHATDVSATYLKGAHATLRECLESDPHSDLCFEVLVLLDLPRGVDAALAEHLTLLAGQAPARGVMLVVHRTEPVEGLDLGPSAVTVEVTGPGTAVLAGLRSAPVSLDPRPPAGAVRRIAARSVRARTPLGFEDLHSDARFGAESTDSVEAPIGRSGRDTIALRFGDAPVNGLLAGVPGSGKSNLLRVLIYGLARRYDATELEMYLLDFKEGVEFQEFAPTAGDSTFLPHAAVVSVNSSREFGVEVLRHLNRVIAHRYELFRAAGAAPKLADLRRSRPEDSLPRVLLVVDEFQRLFDTDDPLAAAAVTELLNIAKQGRAAGVHFLLATQFIADVGAGTSIGSRLDGIFKSAALRVGMQMSDAESRALFSSPQNTAAGSLHEAGVAIVNESGGAEDFNRRTQVALLSAATSAHERREAVSGTRAGRIPPRTFDGASGADAALNRELRSAIRRPAGGLWDTWPAQGLRVDDDSPRTPASVRASFSRDQRRNLAVVGAGARNAASIIQWSVVGLAATNRNARVILVDLLRPEDAAQHGIPQGVADATAAVVAHLGASVSVERIDHVRDLVAVLDSPSGDPAADAPTAVAVLGGMDRLRGLNEILEEDAYSTHGQVLCRVAQEAPSRHVHLLASFATVVDFGDLDPSARTFGYRVYLHVEPTAMMTLTTDDVAIPTGRLALWHDTLSTRAIEAVHVFEPFGATSTPAWLRA